MRFAEGLGLLNRDGKETVKISELGRKYFEARLDYKWVLSDQQKKLLREHIIADPTRTPTIYTIASLLSLVRKGHSGKQLSHLYAEEIEKQDAWKSDVTYQGFTNFGLNYLNELGFIQDINTFKVSGEHRGSEVEGSKWSDEELRASIDSYLEMLSLHRRGKPYIKKDYYRALAKKFGRTEKSFEFRAQNISHVLALIGREWLPGLVPATNVEAKVIERIEKLLAEVEKSRPSGTAAFEAKVRGARKRKMSKKPTGNKNPSSNIAETSQYERDPLVKAWILEKANGICENCEKKAPFVTHDGQLFLEVHHIWFLADGGPDCVENAVAVCPNCHRALHYSEDRDVLKENLYKNIGRLIKG
ncbi:MAG: HNH endonuclease [Candidatus Krumholzibacteriota bacterium]|nr:HNH endonuclease [Candidatus Krumholzibacteriota bacterium]